MNRTVRRPSPAILCLILLLSVGLGQDSAAQTVPASTPRPLTNADVVKLVASGISDAITITSIVRAERVAFDLSPDGLVRLKSAKVGDAVITAMFDRTGNGSTPPRETPPATVPKAPEVVKPVLPSEVGIYLHLAGQFRDVNPEIVNWRTGGFWKRTVTAGMVGGHLNGSVPQPQSALRISSPAEFIVVVQEGFAVTEYQLLRLDQKDDRREFRLMTTSIAGARSGTEGHHLPFEAEKIAPRTYRVRVEAHPGEYGFLPPGVAGANMTAVGRLYGFGVR